MVGVGRLIVIRRMTPRTGIRRVVVVAVVAFGTIVRHGGMRSVERVIIVVNRKRRRLPAIGGVATRAVGRYRQGCMARVGTLVVIRCVTGRTISGCTRVPRRMAVDTGR